MQIYENFSAPTKSHVRETSLFAGAKPNQVLNSQTSRFVSMPGQKPGRSNQVVDWMDGWMFRWMMDRRTDRQTVQDR